MTCSPKGNSHIDKTDQPNNVFAPFRLPSQRLCAAEILYSRTLVLSLSFSQSFISRADRAIMSAAPIHSRYGAVITVELRLWLLIRRSHSSAHEGPAHNRLARAEVGGRCSGIIWFPMGGIVLHTMLLTADDWQNRETGVLWFPLTTSTKIGGFLQLSWIMLINRYGIDRLCQAVVCAYQHPFWQTVKLSHCP